MFNLNRKEFNKEVYSSHDMNNTAAIGFGCGAFGALLGHAGIWPALVIGVMFYLLRLVVGWAFMLMTHHEEDEE